MRRTVILALLVAIVAFAATVGAQTLTGTILGKVTDEQGGVLPGVTVTLTGKTGSQTQVSDAKGEYRFVGLTPGTYSVKAELSGFRPKEQADLVVSIGKTVEVPLAMSVGGLTEQVDVVANAITIDTQTTKTDTNLSQDLLFNMPLSHNNPAVSILQYSPGVNDGSAFGGASDGANSLMLDGVDTRDPEGGTAWAFYNFNIIDEVQVGSLGQPAEYGGFTGAVVNTITKSGGNRFSHLSEYRWTNDSMASNNVPADVANLNPTLGVPNRVLDMKDYTVQLGGPLQKDKIFFFTSIQRYKIQQKNSGAIRSEVSPRFNFKFTFQPNPSDNIVASLQYDNYNQKGRTGLIPGYAVSDNSQTIDQDSPEFIYNAQWRRVFSASTFLEAKYMGWWGYYDLNPVSQAPMHYNVDTDGYSGGAGYHAQYDRTRNQVNIALSRYAQKAGSHNFKFGLEIERSKIRDRFQYSGASTAAPTGVYYIDYNTGPAYAYGYSYDLQGKNKRESYYAQDQWKMGRATLNLGVRADNIRGEDEATGKKLYSTFSVGPRLGAAFDVTGKGTTVLRAFYGQMYDGAVFSSWSRATSGLTPNYGYEVLPDGSLSLFQETLRTYTVSNDVKHPRVDEFNLSFEHQIGRAYKVTATGIFRDYKNFVNSQLSNAIWAPYSYSMPTWKGPGTNPFASLPTLSLYKWANRTDVPQFLIGNTDTVSYTLSDGSTRSAEAYRRYRGLMLMFERAYKNRWQARLSYVLSKTQGTITNSTYAGISSGQFETPNTILVNADGPTTYDRRHEVKFFAGYQIPKVEVGVNALIRYLSGWPYPANTRVSGSRLGWPSTVTVNVDAPGSHMNDAQTTADVRFEKVVNFGIHRFGFYLDINNLFNEATVLSRQARFPSRDLQMSSAYTAPDGTTYKPGDYVTVWFGNPLSLSVGRQVTFGGRWSF